MRPSDIWNNKGLSDPIFILTKADESSQPNWFNRDGRIFCELENSNHPKKKLPTKCWNFFNFNSNIFGSEKRLRLPNSNKFEKFEPKYPTYLFQNRGSLTCKETYSERRIFMQTRRKRCLFFRSTSQNFPEIWQVFLVGKFLWVSLPVLWPGTWSENFFITNQNSNCINVRDV